MRIPRPLLVVLITVAALALLIPVFRTAAKAKPRPDAPVFRETISDPAAYPAVVALSRTREIQDGSGMSGTGHFCEGTLVAADKVVTAAICVQWDVPQGSSEGPPKGPIYVVAGLLDFKNDRTAGDVAEVKSVWLHPGAGGPFAKTTVNIAMLTLTKPLPGKYRPLPIAGPGDEALTAPDAAGATGARGTLVGYGLWYGMLGSYTATSGRLERSTVSFVADNRCRPEFTDRPVAPKPEPKSMACIQGVVHSDAVCSATDGGPVIVNGKLAAIKWESNRRCGDNAESPNDDYHPSFGLAVALAPYSNDLIHGDRVYRCTADMEEGRGVSGEFRIADEPARTTLDGARRGRGYKVSFRITKEFGTPGGNDADVDFENDGSKWSIDNGTQDGRWRPLGPVHEAGLPTHETRFHGRTPLIIFDRDASAWRFWASDPSCNLDIPANP